MSLITDYPLLKVEASLPQNNPCQWTENLQLAICGFTQLAIIEPKLPSLHQGIIKVNNNPVLDPKHLFQMSTILDEEQVQYLPLGKFNKVNVDSADEPFDISYINDPTIVAHQWSSTSQTSRDNMIGVLFNTGELIIMSRKNVQSTKYDVRVQMFEVLAKQLGISFDGEAYRVNSFQKFALKVRCFSLSTISIGTEDTLFLSIIDGNNTLSVYEINQDTYKTKLLVSQELGFKAVKMKWSKWNGKKSYLAITSIDNAIHAYDLSYENDLLGIQIPSILNAPTRFQCGKQEYVNIGNKTYLLSLFTGKLTIFEMGTPIKAYEYTFDTFVACTAIVTGLAGRVLTIILTFEDGNIITLKFDAGGSKAIETIKTDKALKTFIARALYTFQISNTTLDADEEGVTKGETEGNEEESGMEGIFVINGLHPVSSDLLALVYKVIPKDAFSHITRTQYETHLQFVKLDTPLDQPIEAVSKKTSITKAVEYWLSNYEKIPCLESATHEYLKVEAFVDGIEKFTNENLVEIKDLDLQVDSDLGTDFRTMLIELFNRNPIVNQLQYYHTLGKIIINGLIVFKEKSEKLISILDHCKSYLIEIERSISIYLKLLMFEFIKVNNVQLQDEFDKFLMITNYQQLNNLGVEIDVNIPSSAVVTIGTKFYAEKFEVHIDDMIPEDKLIVSTTGHGWLQCKLSNIPLLQMNNRRDELAEFHYIIIEDHFGQLITTLLKTIEFCYITGNKTYKLK
ncbi:uncharacterized protein J8A68_002707 [[Candida] subhashii]|uniref:Transcription factor IIIC 90kDa subunit N-terminal domain-containing protein n=1 Tax=[Candida] subhashii TaxID=561895 RepID=A0A8J5QWX8_9ASCO|nr:uncharacterized protein J8A68_002707 [[Candida] subhashii]KAG7663760.1 hypothetical protein J8A68_002707 [[Candida] subhashii]